MDISHKIRYNIEFILRKQNNLRGWYKFTNAQKQGAISTISTSIREFSLDLSNIPIGYQNIISRFVNNKTNSLVRYVTKAAHLFEDSTHFI